MWLEICVSVGDVLLEYVVLPRPASVICIDSEGSSSPDEGYMLEALQESVPLAVDALCPALHVRLASAELRVLWGAAMKLLLRVL